MTETRTITVTLTEEQADYLSEAAGDGARNWDGEASAVLDEALEALSRALWPLRFPGKPYPET